MSIEVSTSKNSRNFSFVDKTGKSNIIYTLLLIPFIPIYKLLGTTSKIKKIILNGQLGIAR